MSKRGYISRYLLILKKVRTHAYASFEEIKSYIERQFAYLLMQDDDLYTGFSKRTFQRDLREIRNVFGIDIKYDKTRKGYFIYTQESESMNFQRMMEAFDMFNSLNISGELSPFVHMESRRPSGTENIHGLLHAIKNKLSIAFLYQKFDEETPSSRTVHPLGLKEFRNRWYLMAQDTKDNQIKSFGVDRISHLRISDRIFSWPSAYSIEEQFRNCFGIISPADNKPERIVLSLDAFAGKYIKTLPLHPSQKILKEDDEEIYFELHLCITHDLMMELLSHGDSLKVIKPVSLARKLKQAHLSAAARY
jgi:predicted DNA-binding transcriptional regulator YafY